MRCCKLGAQTVVVLGVLFAVIVYRWAIVTTLYGVKNTTAKENARLITTVTASLMNLVAIIILSKVRSVSFLLPHTFTVPPPPQGVGIKR